MTSKAIFFSQEDAIQLKRAIAQLLYEKHMDQSKISLILGLSQPMVSNYCASKKTKQQEILTQATTIAKKILDGEYVHFQQCIIFSHNMVNGSHYIANKNELINDENRTIINQLTQAFINLQNRNLKRFVPKIKINIAQAKLNAVKPDDVAAFVNGLIIADNTIIGNNGIRFGCSTHLSSLLLHLQKTHDIHAIMNVAYLDHIPTSSLSYDYLNKDFKLAGKRDDLDILLHTGDFGLEPCTYIVGTDAIDVSKKLLTLLEGDKL